MIFGYNTDVKSGGIVYHVQTEDRGEKHPVIDSVIYVKGRIVDRRRTPYEPKETPAERLQEMVKKQHRDLVDSIRAGTYVIPESGSPEPAESASRPAAASPPEPAPSVAAKAAPAPQTQAAPAPQTQVAPAPQTQVAPALELTNADELERDGRLLFRLRVSDRANGTPLSGSVLRAVLAPGTPGEARQEVPVSADGIAEVNFDPPDAADTDVLFQAAVGGSAEVIKFRLVRRVRL